MSVREKRNAVAMKESRLRVAIVYVLADGEAVHPRRTPYMRLLEEMRAGKRSMVGR